MGMLHRVWVGGSGSFGGKRRFNSLYTSINLFRCLLSEQRKGAGRLPTMEIGSCMCHCCWVPFLFLLFIPSPVPLSSLLSLSHPPPFHLLTSPTSADILAASAGPVERVRKDLAFPLLLWQHITFHTAGPLFTVAINEVALEER